MADVNIGAKVTVDTGQSVKSINDINKEIKAASEAMKAAKIGTDEYKTAQEQLKKAQEELSATTKEHASTFTQLKEQLHGTVPGFKAAEEGASGLGKQLLALLANPVVLAFAAIAASLVGLYNAFTSTLGGAQKMEQIFVGMKTAMTVLTDRLVTFGNSIIKLFSGDFKGAANDAKAAFSGIGKEITDTYSKATTIQKRLQEIRMEEMQDEKDQHRRKARLSELKEMLNDENYSVQQKKQWAQELKTLATEDGEKDLKRTREKNKLEIDLINVKKNKTEEDLKKINELEIANEDALTAVKQEGTRINRINRNLDKQASAEAAAAVAAEKAAHEELIKKLEEEQKLRTKIWWSMQKDGLMTVKQIRDAENKAEEERLAKLKKSESEMLTRQKELLNGRVGALIAEGQTNAALEEAKRQEDKKTAELKITNMQTVANALSSVSQLIGEQTVVGKGLAAAAAIINTYQGATKALAQGGIFGAIGAAGIIASGLASVKKIMSTNIPGQSSSGASVSIDSGSILTPLSPTAPLSPQSGATTLNSGSIQQIGNAAAPRAFVVESDITNSQERITRLNRAARLG